MKRVAILMNHDIGYCRRVMSGILRFSAEHGGWQFRDGPADGALLPALARWRPDGIIAHLFDRHLAGGLERIDCPVVSTTDTLLQLAVPLVDVDNRAVGVEAARYLTRKGFRHFGYYGSKTARYSIDREAGFRSELRKVGLRCEMFQAEFLPKPPVEEIWQPSSRRLDRWLRDLSKPVAIFCSNDLPARRIAEACSRCGLRVPGDVAILGVDNDESECRLASPPLSSVDTPSERIGYEAAQLLAQLMAGKKPRRKNLRLQPRHVVSRASTDRWATDNDTVARALDYIRENSAKPGLNVTEVVKVAGVSRRSLERLFRQELRCTVLTVIHDAKLTRVKELLLQTDYRIAEIADRAGFPDTKRLSTAFKEATGLTPREYRKVNGTADSR